MSLLNDWHFSPSLARASTQSPFIAHLSAGTLPNENFDAWLYNDFLFARCWTYLIARMIASLPTTKSEFLNDLKSTLESGLDVAKQELEVFKQKASHRNVDLPSVSEVAEDSAEEARKSGWEIYEELSRPDMQAHDKCVDYMRWMTVTLLAMNENGEAVYHWTTLLAAFWMLEKTYCEAMWAVKTSEGFDKLDESTRDFICWWAKDEFKEYVANLQDLTDTGRTGGWGWREEEAKRAMQKVLELEVGFWSIAENGL